MGGYCAKMAAAGLLMWILAGCRAKLQSAPAGPIGDANAESSITGAGGSSGAGGAATSGSGGTATVLEPAGNRSGTRLVWKPRRTSYGVSLGGLQPSYFAESYWGEWYDSFKGHACEFVGTADGKTRCVPPGQSHIASYFLDADCKRPLAVVAKVEFAPEYIGRPPCPDGFMKGRLTGSDSFSVRPVGARVAPQTVYWLSPQQRCEAQSASELDAFFELQPELIYSEWVSAVEVVGDGTTRLRAQYLVGEDGSRSQINWYDTQRREPCRFRISADGQYRCLPRLERAALTDMRPDGVTAPTTVGYVDDQCTIEVCQGGLCDDSTVQYIGRIRDDCDSNVRIHSRGAFAVAMYERSVADPTCHKLPVRSSGIALGPEVPAASFEAAEVVDEAPTGRLRRKLLVTRDGVTEPLHLSDTLLQERCDLMPSEDGTWRCLPLYHQGGVSYTDAVCTMPVMTFNPVWRCDHGAPPPRYAIGVDPSVCPTLYRVYEAGAKVDPPALYHLGFGRACTAGGPLTPGTSVYALAKRNPDEFELVTLEP